MNLSGVERNKFDLVRSWSNELSATCNRIRHLIGKDHWLSDGKHKEAILMGFLRKYALNGNLASCGFIVSNSLNDLSSGEIDILIADPSKDIPWLNESDILIVPPSSVKAHIHVKSKYTKKSLSEVFGSISKANKILSRNGQDTSKLHAIWSSGFFFHEAEPPKISRIKRDIIEFSKSLPSVQYAPKSLFIHPGISISFVTNGENELIVKLVEEDNLTMGIFLQNYHEFVNTIPVSEIGDFLHSNASGKVTIFNIKL